MTNTDANTTTSSNSEKEKEKFINNEVEMKEILPATEEQPRVIRFSSILDPNSYATKKTIAQGMLDVALLTANASQLKYLLQMGERHEFYHLMVTLISISIILQISAGLVMIVKSRFNINKEWHHRRADILNNTLTWIIFAITILNVFISCFVVQSPPL
ncbi:ninjurin-1-like isoform X2 [Tachypleus tridentatus]|uniref:ninjurin-1-like isoform X2 n=1 Tax=Tachypleus tridentatus TaxID=6853 RepID=UPI003FD49A74